MPDQMQTYMEGIQKLNQQRGMTGNQAYNKGMDASLTEGYFDAQLGRNQQQQQLDLQKQNQAFNQNYLTESMKNQKENQTNQLIGSAVGGIANLGMQAWGKSQNTDLINKMFPQKPVDLNAPTQMNMGDLQRRGNVNIGEVGTPFNASENAFINGEQSLYDQTTNYVSDFASNVWKSIFG